MTYAKFKHQIGPDLIEITMRDDTQTRFTGSDDEGDWLEELDIEDGVLHWVITRENDLGTEFSRMTFFCPLDELESNDGLPNWNQETL